MFRTKVFSGNRSSGLSYVPTLFDSCIRVVQQNIDGNFQRFVCIYFDLLQCVSPKLLSTLGVSHSSCYAPCWREQTLSSCTCWRIITHIYWKIRTNYGRFYVRRNIGKLSGKKWKLGGTCIWSVLFHSFPVLPFTKFSFENIYRPRDVTRSGKRD